MTYSRIMQGLWLIDGGAAATLCAVVGHTVTAVGIGIATLCMVAAYR